MKHIDIDCNRELLNFGGGHFLSGKSEALLSKLTERYGGSVQMIYLDPPFATGKRFFANGIPAYTDNAELEEYLSGLRCLLTGARELLTNDGSIYFHIDYRMSARVKLLLDEVFGERNFRNEIIWAYKSGGRATTHFSRKHDTIYFYSKGSKPYFNIAAIGKPRGAVRRNNMKRETDIDGRVFYSIRSNGKLYKYYEDSPEYPSDVWSDIGHLHQRDPERLQYPTQKPEELLKRIILASSREGDLVCDLFSGSGTTAAVACELGRRWLAADSSDIAAATLRNRLINKHTQTRVFEIGLPTLFEYAAQGQSTADIEVVRSDSNGMSVFTASGRNNGETPRQLTAGRINEEGAFVPFAFSQAAKAAKNTARVEVNAADADNIVLQVITASGKRAFFAAE